MEKGLQSDTNLAEDDVGSAEAADNDTARVTNALASGNETANGKREFSDSEQDVPITPAVQSSYDVPASASKEKEVSSLGDSFTGAKSPAPFTNTTELMSFDDDNAGNNLPQKYSFEDISDYNTTDVVLPVEAQSETETKADASFPQESQSVSAIATVFGNGMEAQPSDDVDTSDENFLPLLQTKSYVRYIESKGSVTEAEKPSDNDEDVDDEDKQMRKYLKKMADRYLKSAGKSYSNEKENNQKKRHRCVAAIICHPYQREPFVAVLCTGTKHNYDKCYSTLGLKDSPPCDAHAESLCLEIAPIFLQNEMLNCSSDEKLSIFKYNSNDKKFALESNETKFHLLITEPPCGWIKDKQDPCMEWKPFTEVPHIPTCSARILISSKMGFQGYVSHLLYHPIFLESVIILYTKDHKPNYNFPKNTFDLKLPTISTLEYEPKIFNLAQEPPTFEQMNLGSTQIGAKKRKEHTIGTSAIVIGQGQSALEESYVMNSTYNVHKRLETNHNKSQEQRFAITNREVDSKLPKVDQQIKRERKKEIKRMYDNLIEKLNLIDVLQKQLEECTKYKTNKEMEIKRLLAKYNFADVVAKEVDNLMNKEYDSEQWLSTTRELQKNMEVLGTEGKRLIDVQNLIKDINKLIEDPLRCILDCSWKRYFDEP